jgi:hypothetical protein
MTGIIDRTAVEQFCELSDARNRTPHVGERRFVFLRVVPIVDRPFSHGIAFTDQGLDYFMGALKSTL